MNYTQELKYSVSYNPWGSDHVSYIKVIHIINFFLYYYREVFLQFLQLIMMQCHIHIIIDQQIDQNI